MENQICLSGIAPPLDEGEKEQIQEEEKAPEHLQVRILRNVIDQDDAVLLDFVDKVMPNMIEVFSLMTAKGGTNFPDLHDQSMLTHILNGMLPTLRILKTAANSGARPLTELEQKLYIISYSLHDLNKIVGEKELKRASLDDEEYLGHVRTQMQRLGFDEFLPDYESYLNDITYLIQNTEEKWGANRNLANFGDFGIRPRRLLKSYVESVIDINGQLNLEKGKFLNELERYEKNRLSGRKGERACAICNSNFDVEEQKEAAILFAPQVYSNKLPLLKSNPKRSICEICSIEMLLRQILMPDRFSSIGKNYENRRIRYLYFYPTYFFTPETAKLIGEIYYDLKQINYPQLSKSFSKDSIIYRDVRKWTALEEFMLEDKPDEEEKEESFLVKLQFPKHELATFYFLGIPPIDKSGTNPTDTESWAMPTLMALLSSLALNVKIVVSESMIPLFTSGDDFRETVFLDGPHSFVKHLLKNDRFRLDEVENAIRTVVGAYELQRKVHSERGRMKWNQINGIARNLDTDKLYVFHYLGVLGRKSEFNISRKIASEFMEIYKMIGGYKMAMISGVVERYCKFYKPGGFAAYARVRPFHIAANTIIKSDTEIELDDLKLEIVGEISGWLGRVRSPGTKGYAPLSGKEEIQAVRDFVEYVVHEVFLDYCKGERAILRKRLNRLRAACEAYYLENYGYKKDKEENDVNKSQ